MTDEELRDEVLAIFEEKEPLLLSQEETISNIEKSAMDRFDMKVISIKNKLVEDTTIPEDQLEKRYLEEVDLLRAKILEEVNQEIKDFIEKTTKAAQV